MWECETDNGWQRYDAAQEAALEKAYATGQKSVSVVIKAVQHEVDVCQKQQRNTKTSYVREVRQREASGITAIWQCDTDKGYVSYDETDTKALEAAFTAGTALVTVLGGKNEVNLSDMIQSNVTTKVKRQVRRWAPHVVWECKTDSGHVAYSEDECEQLERAHAKGAGTVKVRGGTHEVDVKGMQQKNIQSKFPRPVQRKILDKIWECKADPGWIPYRATVSLLLNQAVQDGTRTVPVTVPVFQHIISIDALTQKNLTTGVVRKVRRSAAPPAPTPAPPAAPPRMSESEYVQHCKEYLHEILKASGIPEYNRLLDTSYDRSYYTASGKPPHRAVTRTAGEKYELPLGYAGFGIQVPARAHAINMWGEWHVSYHGCAAAVLPSILKEGQLLLPGDTLLDGTVLAAIHTRGDDSRKQLYTSPSVRYSQLDVYTSPKQFKGRVMRVVLQCRQQPNYKVGPETVGWARKHPGESFTPYFSNNEVERFTLARGAIVPYRVLIRAEQPGDTDALAAADAAEARAGNPVHSDDGDSDEDHDSDDD